MKRSGKIVFVASFFLSATLFAAESIETSYVHAFYEAARLSELNQGTSEELTKLTELLCPSVTKDLAKAANKVMELPTWELKNCDQAFNKFKLGSCSSRKTNLARVTLRAAITKVCKL